MTRGGSLCMMFKRLRLCYCFFLYVCLVLLLFGLLSLLTPVTLLLLFVLLMWLSFLLQKIINWTSFHACQDGERSLFEKLLLLLCYCYCYFTRRLLIELASIHDKGERGECLFFQLSVCSPPVLSHLTVTMYTDTRILNVHHPKIAG